MAAASGSRDYLNISSDTALRGKFGTETLIFSDTVTKINRKDVSQERILVVTDKAIYNIAGRKVQRRIELQSLGSVTVSSASTEFVLHIPAEYDYRFASRRRTECVECIRSSHASCVGIITPLVIVTNPAPQLKEIVLTKPLAAAKKSTGSSSSAVSVGAAAGSTGPASGGAGATATSPLPPPHHGSIPPPPPPASGGGGASNLAAVGRDPSARFEMSTAVGDLGVIAEGDEERAE